MQHTWLDLKINNPTAGVDTGQCTGLNFVRTKNKVISAQKAVVCSCQRQKISRGLSVLAWFPVRIFLQLCLPKHAALFLQGSLGSLTLTSFFK